MILYFTQACINMDYRKKILYVLDAAYKTYRDNCMISQFIKNNFRLTWKSKVLTVRLINDFNVITFIMLLNKQRSVFYFSTY